MRTIADEGRTVLFSSHLLDEVERVADHVTMINHGRIVLSGPLDTIKQRAPGRIARRDLHRQRRDAADHRTVMRSPAAHAFAWEFGQQHRWGVRLIAVYVLFMFITGMLGIDWALTSDAGVGRFIGTIVLPLTAAVLYLLAVFSFGLSGDVAARQSMYPPRLFTLPVTTAALAGWPMLFGAVAMVVLAQAVTSGIVAVGSRAAVLAAALCAGAAGLDAGGDLAVLSGSRAARRGCCRQAHHDRHDRDRRDRAQAARVGDGGACWCRSCSWPGSWHTRPSRGRAAATCPIGAGHSRRSASLARAVADDASSLRHHSARRRGANGGSTAGRCPSWSRLCCRSRSASCSSTPPRLRS